MQPPETNKIATCEKHFRGLPNTCFLLKKQEQWRLCANGTKFAYLNNKTKKISRDKELRRVAAAVNNRAI